MVKRKDYIKRSGRISQFSEPRRAHVTPLFISIHCLLVLTHKVHNFNACIQISLWVCTLLLLLTLTRQYPLLKPNIWSEGRLMVPSQRGTTQFPEYLHSLFLVGGMIFTTPFIMPYSRQYSKDCWKLISPISTNSSMLFFFFFILYYSKQCLKLCIMHTSWVYLPLYDESFVVFQIKASAKLISAHYSIFCLSIHDYYHWFLDKPFIMSSWMIWFGTKYVVFS